LQLSTGALDFEAAGEPSFPSLRVLLTQPPTLGEARAALEAHTCCSVHSFLPPSAFLVHCPSAACHASATALAHVTDSAPLPPRLKFPAGVLTTEGGEWAILPTKPGPLARSAFYNQAACFFSVSHSHTPKKLQAGAY
jgi:hypothetical protein